MDAAHSEVEDAGAGTKLVIDVEALGLRIGLGADGRHLVADSTHAGIVRGRHENVLDLSVLDDMVQAFHPIAWAVAKRRDEAVRVAPCNDQSDGSLLSGIQVLPLAQAHAAQVQDGAAGIVTGDVGAGSDLKSFVGALDGVVGLAAVVLWILAKLFCVLCSVLAGPSLWDIIPVKSVHLIRMRAASVEDESVGGQIDYGDVLLGGEADVLERNQSPRHVISCFGHFIAV